MAVSSSWGVASEKSVAAYVNAWCRRERKKNDWNEYDTKFIHTIPCLSIFECLLYRYFDLVDLHTIKFHF